ncbi:hypothetical protein BGZ63DRAFT_409391 [Mariannaea sp. PMI_226]|nr:hypothetical protein BGZ63DRAFT_409391 [Mariannaea sp. PMI_226]
MKSAALALTLILSSTIAAPTESTYEALAAREEHVVRDIADVAAAKLSQHGVTETAAHKFSDREIVELLQHLDSIKSRDILKELDAGRASQEEGKNIVCGVLNEVTHLLDGVLGGVKGDIPAGVIHDVTGDQLLGGLTGLVGSTVGGAPGSSGHFLKPVSSLLDNILGGVLGAKNLVAGGRPEPSLSLDLGIGSGGSHRHAGGILSGLGLSGHHGHSDGSLHGSLPGLRLGGEGPLGGSLPDLGLGGTGHQGQSGDSHGLLPDLGLGLLRGNSDEIGHHEGSPHEGSPHEGGNHEGGNHEDGPHKGGSHEGGLLGTGSHEGSSLDLDNLLGGDSAKGGLRGAGSHEDSSLDLGKLLGGDSAKGGLLGLNLDNILKSGLSILDLGKLFGSSGASNDDLTKLGFAILAPALGLDLNKIDLGNVDPSALKAVLSGECKSCGTPKQDAVDSANVFAARTESSVVSHKRDVETGGILSVVNKMVAFAARDVAELKGPAASLNRAVAEIQNVARKVAFNAAGVEQL